MSFRNNLFKGNYMKSLRIILVVFLFTLITNCSYVKPDSDVLFQASTINALMEGVYDGEITYDQLSKNGDFGIGTFNALDGEMIGYDGIFYQIKADGKVYDVNGDMQTPYASVTFFNADQSLMIDKEMDFDGLKEYLDSLITSKNTFYAIKIKGEFKYVKTRSVPGQKKPYPRLVEVVKNQPVFEFQDVKGTIVGFRSPEYVKGIRVPGYHLHFINAEKTGGGHLLRFETKQVTVELDYTPEFFLVLPEKGGFHQVELSKEKEGELEKIEQ